MKDSLILRQAKVLFYQEVSDNGYKPSITIEVTQENHPLLEKFWSDNKIGKSGQSVPVGQMNLKEHNGTYQLAIKLSPSTKYAGISGLKQSDIGFGAIVDLYISAYEYSNAFTGGRTFVGVSVSSVLITQAAQTGGQQTLQELLSAYNSEE